jgi:hypothetical protein
MNARRGARGWHRLLLVASLAWGLVVLLRLKNSWPEYGAVEYPSPVLTPAANPTPEHVSNVSYPAAVETPVAALRWARTRDAVVEWAVPIGVLYVGGVVLAWIVAGFEKERIVA